MIGHAAQSAVPLSTMAVLILSVLTVSRDYCVVLPLFPYLIERLPGAGGDTTAGAQYPFLLGPSIAAPAMSGSWALVAINALMRRRTTLTGLHQNSATVPAA